MKKTSAINILPYTRNFSSKFALQFFQWPNHKLQQYYFSFLLVLSVKIYACFLLVSSGLLEIDLFGPDIIPVACITLIQSIKNSSQAKRE